MDNKDPHTIPFLMASLKESQDTVRSYDTKAQIIGIGYIFSINIVASVGDKIEPIAPIGVSYVVWAWILSVVPIVMFGAILYPTRKVAPRLGQKPEGVQRIFYVEPEVIDSVKQHQELIHACNIQRELSYEILKTANLRSLKRKRFLRALSAAAISYIVMFVAQVNLVQHFLTF